MTGEAAVFDYPRFVPACPSSLSGTRLSSGIAFSALALEATAFCLAAAFGNCRERMRVHGLSWIMWVSFFASSALCSLCRTLQLLPGRTNGAIYTLSEGFALMLQGTSALFASLAISRQLLYRHSLFPERAALLSDRGSVAQNSKSRSRRLKTLLFALVPRKSEGAIIGVFVLYALFVHVYNAASHLPWSATLMGVVNYVQAVPLCILAFTVAVAPVDPAVAGVRSRIGSVCCVVGTLLFVVTLSPFSLGSLLPGGCRLVGIASLFDVELFLHAAALALFYVFFHASYHSHQSRVALLFVNNSDAALSCHRFQQHAQW